MEFGIDYDVKCAFLGRLIATLGDEVEFRHPAGSQLHRESQTQFSVYGDASRDITWAEEKPGVIRCLEDTERFPWPDPDRMDVSAFEQIRGYLKPGMKEVACQGYVFTAAFCYALYEQLEPVRRLYARRAGLPDWEHRSGLHSGVREAELADVSACK